MNYIIGAMGLSFEVKIFEHVLNIYSNKVPHKFLLELHSCNVPWAIDAYFGICALRKLGWKVCVVKIHLCFRWYDWSYKELVSKRRINIGGFVTKVVLHIASYSKDNSAKMW